MPKFSHPCDSKDRSHARSNLKVGNPQASSCVKPSHTSITKLPPEVTQGSLLSPQGPWLLLSTFALTVWKGRLQNLKSSTTGSENGPVQFPLQTQGMDGRRRRRSQPWAPEEAQHHLEHPKVSHPLHPHSPAQLGGAQYPTAASPCSCAHASKCTLKHRMTLLPSVQSWSRLVRALGLDVTETCPENASKGQVLHTLHPHGEAVQPN